jgi:hypothetical protein
MGKDAFVATVPVFDAESPVEAALDDANVATCGAVVSTDGSGYWLHSMDDLAAARGASLAVLQARGLRLQPSSVAEAWTAGLVLKVPSPTEQHAAARALGISLGVAPQVRGGLSSRMALVFTDLFSGYVVVGNTYVCSKFNEEYDESDYRANNGKCPVHIGGRLRKKP